MTQDEILAMARQAGIFIRGHYDEIGSTPSELERFAAVVAAAEREGIADLKRQRDALLAALESLLSIASDSEGVAGYYLDGAVANWDEFPEVKKADLLVSWLSVDSLGEL